MYLKNLNKRFIFGFIFLGFQSANGICVDKNVYKKDLGLTMIEARNKQNCILQITPRGKPTGNYLSINSQGQLQSVLSLGDSKKLSRDIAFHTYFILPAEEEISILDKNPDTPVKIKLASGHVLELGSDGAPQIKSFEGCEKKETQRPWMTRGNLNISCPGFIVIDAGEKRSSPNTDKPTNTATVWGENNKSCKVKNSDFLEYKKVEAKGDVEFSVKARTHEQVARFLKSQPQCREVSFRPRLEKTMKNEKESFGIK